MRRRNKDTGSLFCTLYSSQADMVLLQSASFTLKLETNQITSSQDVFKKNWRGRKKKSIQADRGSLQQIKKNSTQQGREKIPRKKTHTNNVTQLLSQVIQCL